MCERPQFQWMVTLSSSEDLLQAMWIRVLLDTHWFWQLIFLEREYSSMHLWNNSWQDRRTLLCSLLFPLSADSFRGDRDYSIFSERFLPLMYSSLEEAAQICYRFNFFLPETPKSNRICELSSDLLQKFVFPTTDGWYECLHRGGNFTASSRDRYKNVLICAGKRHSLGGGHEK